jgi:hypothetical protein
MILSLCQLTGNLFLTWSFVEPFYESKWMVRIYASCGDRLR